ncbi:hypothetical protein LR48_Vigan03g172600 [Vigna angularis]|uniref:Uncharacterized protein n=2 Tax=Phaseolus angularis TaxID=3914 RepID=A0A0L9U7C4_PHAAN|nr:hypothetical protein LR48_Vigan03g172600 [Vigna angularis]BAT84740.1 hypothetical protein VIGAN_04218300 [Vigna angularis var. angularis]
MMKKNKVVKRRRQVLKLKKIKNSDLLEMYSVPTILVFGSNLKRNLHASYIRFSLGFIRFHHYSKPAYSVPNHGPLYAQLKQHGEILFQLLQIMPWHGLN